MTPPTGTGGKDNADREKGRYCENGRQEEAEADRIWGTPLRNRAQALSTVT